MKPLLGLIMLSAFGSTGSLERANPNAGLTPFAIAVTNARDTSLKKAFKNDFLIGTALSAI